MRFQFPSAALPILVLMSGLILSACGSGDSSDPVVGSGGITWTYMVYMAADNSLSPYAKMDINEMEAAWTSEQVKVVVEAKFNPDSTVGVPAQTVRGLVAHDDDDEHMGNWYSQIGDKDMADPETLRDFIAWAARTHPSDRYALVLWSHGQGWKEAPEGASKGMIIDGTSPIMSMQEVSRALRESGVHFEVIDFDACLMGMYEVAYELKGTASYLLFSEEEYPANGDPYTAVLNGLAEDPSMDGRALSGVIASQCLAFYQEADISMTRSAVDMSLIEELHTDMDSLAQYLVSHMDTLKPTIELSRSEACAYDYPANIDLWDFLQKLHDNTDDTGLRGLVEKIIGNGAQSGLLQRMIVENDVNRGTGDTTHAGIASSKGIAIYLPSSDPANNQINTVDLEAYADLACNQSAGGETWSIFLNVFLE